MIGIGIGTHRRQFSDFDSDAQALFDRMATPPTNARKAIINTLIVGLKNELKEMKEQIKINTELAHRAHKKN